MDFQKCSHRSRNVDCPDGVCYFPPHHPTSFVLPDTSRKSRQKTRVVRRTVDPVFNHTMVYDGIRDIDLSEACVELTVWDRDKLATSLLGGLRLGMGTGRDAVLPG